MSAPLVKNTYVYLIEMFDSYSKAIMRNQCRDLLRKEKNRRLDVVVSENAQYIFEQQGYQDTYPSDSFLLTGIGSMYVCFIEDERLYNALRHLNPEKRTMLIMSYWYGMSDIEIAKYLNVTSRTIFNWRKDVFRRIRNDYERGSP